MCSVINHYLQWPVKPHLVQTPSRTLVDNCHDEHPCLLKPFFLFATKQMNPSSGEQLLSRHILQAQSPLNPIRRPLTGLKFTTYPDTVPTIPKARHMCVPWITPSHHTVPILSALRNSSALRRIGPTHNTKYVNETVPVETASTVQHPLTF